MAQTLTTNYSWVKPDPGASANTWGVTLNGDLDKIDAQVWSLNGQVGANTLNVARGPDGGAYGSLQFNNYGNTQGRWLLFETSDTESGGGNAGSNFGLAALDNTGAWLGSAFSIARATQAVTFAQGVTVNGVLTASGNMTVGGTLTAGAVNASGANVSGTLTAANATVSGALTGNAASFSGSVTVNGNTTTNGVVYANNTLQVTNSASVGGNMVVGNNVMVMTSQTSNNYLLGANSSTRYVQFSPSWALTWRNSDGMLYWNTTLGSVFQLDGSGNLYLNGGLTQHSDAASKANITAFADDPLAIIRHVAPKWFNRKTTPDRRELGFVAQDVQAALPEAVRGDSGKLGIAETPLVAVLWRAVQQLVQRVEELEARL